MPTDVAIIVTVIVCAFVVFAGVLAWGDAQTRNLPKGVADEAAPPDRLDWAA